jgi:ribosomal-protein-alanine N-acetyltransferase
VVKIRIPRVEDLSSINEIEEESFPHPWDPDVFHDIVEHQGRLMLKGAMIRMVVAMRGDRVLGYIVWTEGQNLQEGHILNIAVRKKMWGKSVGRELLQYSIDSMTQQNMNRVRLEVREGNLRARRFYEQLGFQQEERIPAYYEDEDALCYFLRF